MIARSTLASQCIIRRHTLVHVVYQHLTAFSSILAAYFPHLFTQGVEYCCQRWVKLMFLATLASGVWISSGFLIRRMLFDFKIIFFFCLKVCGVVRFRLPPISLSFHFALTDTTNNKWRQTSNRSMPAHSCTREQLTVMASEAIRHNV